METMTKTTVITWSQVQVGAPIEVARQFTDVCIEELRRLTETGKTTGVGVANMLEDGRREIKVDWADEESAQAWLDFVLTTFQATYGTEFSYQSGIIEDIAA